MNVSHFMIQINKGKTLVMIQNLIVMALILNDVNHEKSIQTS